MMFTCSIQVSMMGDYNLTDDDDDDDDYDYDDNDNNIM